MTRPHVEFIFSQELEWVHEGGPASREGLAHKRLSFDDSLGELTTVIAFSAGWSATLDSGFQEEVYVLDGHLEIDGRRLERDGYFRVPASSHRWTSTAGGVALVFFNVSSVDDDADFVAIDTTSMPWDA